MDSADQLIMDSAKSRRVERLTSFTLTKMNGLPGLRIMWETTV